MALVTISYLFACYLFVKKWAYKTEHLLFIFTNILLSELIFFYLIQNNDIGAYSIIFTDNPLTNTDVVLQWITQAYISIAITHIIRLIISVFIDSSKKPDKHKSIFLRWYVMPKHHAIVNILPLATVMFMFHLSKSIKCALVVVDTFICASIDLKQLLFKYDFNTGQL